MVYEKYEYSLSDYSMYVSMYVCMYVCIHIIYII